MRRNRFVAPTTAFWQKIFLIALGILLFFIFLEIGLRLGGFAYLSLQEYRNRIADRQKQAYRIMCLGESTTAMGGDDSYPSQLEKILNEHRIGITFSVINRGVSAVATSYILAHLEQNIDKYNPLMVITMMGIGDGSDLIYRDTSTEKSPSVFESLKICKLTRLLWLHITAKAKEMGLYQSPKTKEPAAPVGSKNTGIAPGAEASGEDGTTGMFCENINVSKARVETARNYRELKRILDKRGIKLVCVQYPMLKIGELKQIFEGQRGVVFVDNERVFKDAVKKSGYQKYFVDRFGGEFGHCTREGNRLLAQNIADVILKEYFNK
jgi:hypothetical protein